ncbi:MFS transporter [Syntrophomonas curvata]
MFKFLWRHPEQDRCHPYRPIGFGLGSLVCGLLPPDLSVFWIFAALCAVMGAARNLSNIPYMAYLQQAIRLKAQGRVLSLVISLMSLAMPVGLVIAAPITQAYGVANWFLITGIAMVIIMLLSAMATLPGKLSYSRDR